MIRNPESIRALEAIQALIVRGRLLAYESGEAEIASLLDDVEILPAYLADSADRTAEFEQMLAGIVEKRPDLRYILSRFEGVETPSEPA